jgi:UDP-N-acetylglucosamine 2-epimerase (non-hydrolysing)
MMRFEEVVQAQPPDMVLVYGDVNSTVAAALVCAKLQIAVGHVEAGLRSFDRTMPEEINRLMTDQIADLLFTPSHDGNDNLAREGVAAEKVFLVGNVMIDTLVRLLPHALESFAAGPLAPWQQQPYALATLHRPSNVDDPAMLSTIMRTLATLSRDIPVLLPIHPRTRQRLAALDETLRPWEAGQVPATLHMIDPLGYLDFLALQRHATLVITDSGGIQEETTFLGVPCLTLRDNTERPITVTMGTNTLVGRDMECLRHEVQRVLAGERGQSTPPPLWDGHAAERIAAIVTGQG